MEKVILVNEQDRSIGECEKQQAHVEKKLHRAFSVFVFRQNNHQLELLLQQREPSKYHSGGLWTNTCCGHPRPGEETALSGQRRLKEEMGFSLDLKEVGIFQYCAALNDELTENEIDHVLVGYFGDEEIAPNPTEVVDYKWVAVDALKNELQTNRSRYTAWFEEAFLIALGAQNKNMV